LILLSKCGFLESKSSGQVRRLSACYVLDRLGDEVSKREDFRWADLVQRIWKKRNRISLSSTLAPDRTIVNRGKLSGVPEAIEHRGTSRKRVLTPRSPAEAEGSLDFW